MAEKNEKIINKVEMISKELKEKNNENNNNNSIKKNKSKFEIENKIDNLLETIRANQTYRKNKSKDNKNVNTSTNLNKISTNRNVNSPKLSKLLSLLNEPKNKPYIHSTSISNPMMNSFVVNNNRSRNNKTINKTFFDDFIKKSIKNYNSENLNNNKDKTKLKNLKKNFFDAMNDNNDNKNKKNKNTNDKKENKRFNKSYYKSELNNLDTLLFGKLSNKKDKKIKEKTFYLKTIAEETKNGMDEISQFNNFDTNQNISLKNFVV